MGELIQGIRSDRAQRLIDWSVFAVGAASLALALVLTLSSLLIAAPASATTAPPPALLQHHAI